MWSVKSPTKNQHSADLGEVKSIIDMGLSKKATRLLYHDFCRARHPLCGQFVQHLESPGCWFLSEEALPELREEYYLLSILLPAMKEYKLVYPLVIDEYYERLSKHFG